MNKQKITTGYLLIAAAVTFWTSWFLMPDPGTTDAGHILNIVKQTRTSVMCSVITQIISSVLYIVALIRLASISINNKLTMAGILVLGVGTLGLCSDAFFHLLAWAMTDNTVSIGDNVVQTMHLMQTRGLLFLVPILIPFFIGSLLLSIGLKKQRIISGMPVLLFSLVFLLGPASVLTANKFMVGKGPVMMMLALGLFAIAHVLIGYKLIKRNNNRGELVPA